MQICGPHAADGLVIRVGAAYEAATAWHLAQPLEHRGA
jgi:Asp-tRNA(Asn)/Glu-tRNA(Gln) amidotransferase A subunit family amidase